MGIFLNISVSLALLCLLGADTQGAPTKGRYMWVKCRPDGKNTNCVTEKGPVIKIPGRAHRLPPSAANEILKDQTEDGSGAGQVFPDLGSGDLWVKDGRELGVFQPEEGSADLDGFPDPVFRGQGYQKDGLSLNKEIQEDNLIL
ncbi:hypothetical protein AGOR_G00100630 [Albula goreensis]|uniref:Serglycin n=1 Tax=Albula goreensis TaxID=1534307 RepID=A0A8T3DI88_9TELE|nr:hypothetical protein AGOR_G00100630 [Albula goreensis]